MAAHGAAIDPNEPVVYEQYETIEQQQETYLVGMWSFLVTEVMMFGALFLVYSLYRWKFRGEFFMFHEELSWQWGGLNTMNLLFSSFLMAKAVQATQLKRAKAQMWYLAGTIVCAFIFLIIKAIEWIPKFEHHLVPTASFHWPPHEPHGSGGGSPEHAKIFYSLYFTMTGLHGLHVVIGIIAITILMVMTKLKAKAITDYIPTEMVGLYWHFVDLVWIFLYPLFYLIPR
ncbi:MAG: cytochrome c oxidase subunit 3 [Armatimonadetes bacterium]|nr:cytochrome c oxidase subunit 3 [Armatimonadota bacterium]